MWTFKCWLPWLELRPPDYTMVAWPGHLTKIHNSYTATMHGHSQQLFVFIGIFWSCWLVGYTCYVMDIVEMILHTLFDLGIMLWCTSCCAVTISPSSSTTWPWPYTVPKHLTTVTYPRASTRTHPYPGTVKRVHRRAVPCMRTIQRKVERLNHVQTAGIITCGLEKATSFQRYVCLWRYNYFL